MTTRPHIKTRMRLVIDPAIHADGDKRRAFCLGFVVFQVELEEEEDCNELSIRTTKERKKTGMTTSRSAHLKVGIVGRVAVIARDAKLVQARDAREIVRKSVELGDTAGCDGCVAACWNAAAAARGAVIRITGALGSLTLTYTYTY